MSSFYNNSVAKGTRRGAKTWLFLGKILGALLDQFHDGPYKTNCVCAPLSLSRKPRGAGVGEDEVNTLYHLDEEGCENRLLTCKVPTTGCGVWSRTVFC